MHACVHVCSMILRELNKQHELFGVYVRNAVFGDELISITFSYFPAESINLWRRVVFKRIP